MADDNIQWQLEIDGKGALDTLQQVKASAKEIDLSSKTVGNLKAMVAELLSTNRMAQQVADAVKMESRARQDNLRLAEKQKQTEKDRADAAAKAARTERENALSGLRNVAIGGTLGALAMVRGMAGSGFQDTLQGQQAQVYGQLLNRQVASIFAPLLEEKTKYVAQMTQWLQGLDGPQRESIRAMTMFAGSLGVLGFVVPKVTRGLAAAAVGFLAGGAEGKAGQAVMGAAGPIGLGIAGIAAILMSSERGRESLANLAKAFEPLIPAFSNLIETLTPPIAQLANATADLIRFLDRQFPASQNGIPSNPVMFGSEIGHCHRQWIRSLLGLPDEGPFRPVMPPSMVGPGGGNALSPIPKGFEEIEAAFTRINESATKFDLQQQQLTQLQNANTTLEQIAVNTTPPPQLQGAVGLNNLIGF